MGDIKFQQQTVVNIAPRNLPSWYWNFGP